MARPISLAAAALLTATVAGAQPQGQLQAIDPTADAQLHWMSDYLAMKRSFQFDAVVTDEAVTSDGQKMQFVIDQRVSVRRPDRLRTDRRGRMGDTIFRYDGRRFTVLDKFTGYYALAPAPAKLDAAIDTARDRYGIDAPGADLLLSDTYAELMKDAVSGRYLGLEWIEGVPCHHLAYQGKDVDWQIWIQDGPQPLPRRYEITSKNEPGQPEFVTTLKNWKTNLALPDTVFAFQPPPGSTEITFQPMGPLHGAR